MRYLKTYDKMINFDLDENIQSLVLVDAIKRNNIDLIKKLFDSGLDPNMNFSDYGQPIFLTILEQTPVNIDIVKLFIKYGVNIHEKFYNDGLSIFHYVMGLLLDKKTKHDYYIELLSIFLEAGANLLLEDKHKKENYLETIERFFINEYITKKMAIKIFDTIKEKAPEQYEQYAMKKAAKKYNI
jgi:hypothetical protein